MIKKIKQTLLKSAKTIGVLDHLGNSKWRQNRLLILGYHGVSMFDEDQWNPQLFMPPAMLRERFELIRKTGCTVLPLSEAIGKLYDGTLPKRAVSITFDDGLFNFFSKAVPLLNEFDFHATLYATTYYVEYNNPVFGVATDYLLWKARSEKLDCRSLIDSDEVLDLSVEKERRRALDLINEYVRKNKFSAEQKNELLRKLCTALGTDFVEFCTSRILQLMTTAELAAVASRGVDVELHTHRHRAPLNEELFIRELDDNRRVIEHATSKRPAHFCYPDGRHDSRYLPWLQRAQILSATTCVPGLAERGSHRFMLPRVIDANSLSLSEFEGWLEGVSDFFPQRSW